MVSIPLIDYMRENNILSGLILIDLIAFISYLIFPTGLIYFGDFQMSIGCIIGTRFALKNIKPNQSFLSLGLVVGLFGSVLTGISFSFFDWVVYSSSPRLYLIIFELYLLEAITIGLVIGALTGFYYHRKHKSINLDRSIDEQFYKSLEEK